MGLLLKAWAEKTVSGVETHWITCNEKVQGTAAVTKIMVTVFWDMKEPITVDFLEKGATVNSSSYCQLLEQYFI